MTTRRTTIVTGLVLLTPLVGCAPAPLHAKICADTELTQRALDERCDEVSTSQRFRWVYYDPQVVIPAVGGKLPRHIGTFREPDGTVVRIPAEGGVTARQVEKGVIADE